LRREGEEEGGGRVGVEIRGSEVQSAVLRGRKGAIQGGVW